jgi:hypothetical protein
MEYDELLLKHEAVVKTMGKLLWRLRMMDPALPTTMDRVVVMDIYDKLKDYHEFRA